MHIYKSAMWYRQVCVYAWVFTPTHRKVHWHTNTQTQPDRYIGWRKRKRHLPQMSMWTQLNCCLVEHELSALADDPGQGQRSTNSIDRTLLHGLPILLQLLQLLPPVRLKVQRHLFFLFLGADNLAITLVPVTEFPLRGFVRLRFVLAKWSLLAWPLASTEQSRLCATFIFIYPALVCSCILFFIFWWWYIVSVRVTRWNVGCICVF